MRLASVGAIALIEAVEAGGEDESAALAAFPFADDGELALERLARLATSRSTKAPVLTAILGIAGRPRTQREPLDPAGAKAAAEAMIALARQESFPREERALAISAARALAEKGYVDPASILSDLD